MRIVTLLTDFGISEGYAAQMKAVILRKVPDVRIIDISHAIKPHNILMGSFVLETSTPYFPTGTIHVAVVDPGVGGNRLPIIVVCKKAVLVGPDNGLLARASERLGFVAAYRIETRNLPVSSTFHGRDIFAVVAAKIIAGEEPSGLGSKINKIVKLQIPEPKMTDMGMVCHVIHIDNFGNVVTNIRENIPSISRSKISNIALTNPRNGSKRQIALVSSYSEIPSGQIGLLKGSQGYYEIAAREASAADQLGVQVLDEIFLNFTRSYRSQKYHVIARRRQSS